MPIYQVNIWICEVPDCNTIKTTVTVTSPYSDPGVFPPDNIEWDYLDLDGKEVLACPKHHKIVPMTSDGLTS